MVSRIGVWIFVALMAAVLVSGCSTYGNQIAQQGPLSLRAELKSNATLDVLGPAVGTSTGGYLFGFIPIGMESKSGSVVAPGAGMMGSFGGAMLNPVQQAALYNAIDSVPDADALLSPRWHTVGKNYLIYSEYTVTVKGKAIRYNSSGVSRATP